MSRTTRVTWVVAGAILAVVLFLLLRPDDDEATAPTTTARATTAVTSPTTTAPPVQEAVPVRIIFRGGRVIGGIRHARVQRGDRVRLIVRADLADEVHLHGYDISRRVRPGAPTVIVFRATVVGRFEVELEERKIPLAELEVRP
jgi:hypothetical protein